MKLPEIKVMYCEDCSKELVELDTVVIELIPVSIYDEPELIYVCSECAGE